MRKIIVTLCCLLLSFTFLSHAALAANAVPKAVMNTKASVVRIEATFSNGYASGSGFVIYSDETETLVVTNYHVVSGEPDSISVWLAQEASTLAHIAAYSEEKDLCVLRFSTVFPMQALVFAKQDSVQGDAVYAIGFPAAADILYQDEAHSNKDATITDGIVSAVRETQIVENGAYITLLQTSAAINAGNSGGPLFNPRGEVIGVTTFGVSDAQGIFGAIAVNELAAFLEDNGLPIPQQKISLVLIIVISVLSALLLASLVFAFILRARKRIEQKEITLQPSPDNCEEVRKQRPRKKINVKKKAAIPCVIFVVLLLVGGYLGTYFGARSHAEQGNWQNADQLLLIPTLTELHDPELISYIHAKKLLESEDYDSAKAEFEALGTYLDSETMVNETDYQLASDYLENGDFETALDIYLSLSDIGYRDSSDMYVETLHAKACSLIEDGKYFGALNSLESIEDIENYPAVSETLTELKRTFYQEGSSYYFDGDYSRAASFFNNIPDYFDTWKFLLLIDARTTTNRFEIAEYYPQLLDIISFQDAEDIMLSSPYYRLFLQGRWEGDGYYFTMDENATVWTNLPSSSNHFDYYQIKNGEYQNYNSGDSRNQYVTQFSFHISSESWLSVYCHYNHQTYWLSRVS